MMQPEKKRGAPDQQIQTKRLPCTAVPPLHEPLPGITPPGEPAVS